MVYIVAKTFDMNRHIEAFGRQVYHAPGVGRVSQQENLAARAFKFVRQTTGLEQRFCTVTGQKETEIEVREESDLLNMVQPVDQFFIGKAESA